MGVPGSINSGLAYNSALFLFIEQIATSGAPNYFGGRWK